MFVCVCSSMVPTNTPEKIWLTKARSYVFFVLLSSKLATTDYVYERCHLITLNFNNNFPYSEAISLLLLISLTDYLRFSMHIFSSLLLVVWISDGEKKYVVIWKK